MATLTNTKIKDTYDGLLKTTDNEALDASGVTLIEDGLGNASALSVGRSGNGVSVTGDVGIGTSSPLGTTHIKSGASGFTGTLNANYDDLAIEGGGNTGITILTPNNNNAGIAFSDEDAEVQGLILYSHSDDAMKFRTNGTEQLSINSAGNAFFTKGIFLNGETAAANQLNDYEEGEWTPVVADADTGGNEATGSFAGVYTKIGRQVTIMCQLQNIDTTGMTSGNDVFITGLPFTSGSLVGSQQFAGSLTTNDLTASANSLGFAANLLESDTFFKIAEMIDGATRNFVTVSQLDSGVTDIWVNLTYFTN